MWFWKRASGRRLNLRRLGHSDVCRSLSDFSAAVPDSSFGPLRQVDAGLAERRLRRRRPGRGPGRSFCCTAGRTTSTVTSTYAPVLAEAGYRVIVPYLRGFGTTRFLSDETFRNGEQAVLAVDVIALMDALEIEQRDRRRLRLGRANGRHRRRALAGALHRARLGERLPDRQPRGKPKAAAAEGGAGVVVPVLLRHRARPRRLRQEPARVRQADLADRLAEVGASTTPRSTAAPRPSTIPITSTS